MGRLNRYGDQIDDEPAPAGADDHSTTCANGWLGEDAQGRPIPCARCRPHLHVGHEHRPAVTLADHRRRAQLAEYTALADELDRLEAAGATRDQYRRLLDIVTPCTTCATGTTACQTLTSTAGQPCCPGCRHNPPYRSENQ